ncbi:MAG: polysaccharide deacetylase family protein [Clostridia bacterium]
MKNKKGVLILLILLLIITDFVVVFIFKGKTRKNVDIYNDIKLEEKNNKENDKMLNIVQEEVVPKEIKASVPIFMYHFILDDYGNYPDKENFLKVETLEEQLKYISENNYQTIFVNELDKLYNYTKPVALTFDDCFVYFYNNAFPLFRKYKQKATLNIIYNYINGENYLTEAQIKEMIDSGFISIESHTLTHADLVMSNADKRRSEILSSKEKIENKFAINLTTMCYPYGKYNQDIINITKEKYKYGLAMSGGMYYSNKHDLYNIPRIYANRSMPLTTYISYLKKSDVSIKW